MWKKWLSHLTEHDGQKKDIYSQLGQGEIPKHIAIIMDGNGRWAQKRGMPRAFGHRAGADTLREIVRTASDIGVRVLTAYGFSTENWKRPQNEVGLLMNLIGEYLDSDMDEMHKNDVKIRFIGNIAELDDFLQRKIKKAEELTFSNKGLILNLAINYGGRIEITRAARRLAEMVKNGELEPQEITDDVFESQLYTAGLPDPDILIRPSGDLRISNFLLWQCAYAELWMTELNWPDFSAETLVQAILDFRKRERRFGGLKKK